MKGKEYIRSGTIQKVEVCLDNDEKRKIIKMKGKDLFFESTGAVQMSGVGLDHHYMRIEEMNQSKFIVKTTEKNQKVEVGLRHLEDSILVEMKGNKYLV